MTVGFDVDYKGAALIAIDADILLGKSFSVSVELIRLAGEDTLYVSCVLDHFNYVTGGGYTVFTHTSMLLMCFLRCFFTLTSFDCGL